MALQKDYNMTVEFIPNVRDDYFLEKLSEQKKTEEIQFKKCYHKIVDLKGDKNKIEFIVGIYENSTCERLVSHRIYSFVPTVEDNADNFIKQGYEYLKTLDEYAGAKDC